ncbi:hypothetical protein SAMN04489712_112229 [Thermomonospora echinospora]|uniref:Sulfotransferase family protein n=1 Tax=Thermomonospora echinospora TaxID=1992 RepID=A0A1H6D2H6_9ACTN|nr:hypothetical protein [Thermomonospora echinospora]SEG79522.1 hypothetical protein SAMN04489712_112229 [Thermomonospora echinospora]
MSKPAPGAARVRPHDRRQIVYLHLGTPKSGTTYLQNVMWRNRDRLREHGVLYPGDAAPAHYWATLDLQEAAYRGHVYPEVPGAWDRLVEEVREWGGTAVISHELLTRATPEQAKRALATLDFAEVHLVLTVRDLVRQIPAAWQETVKNKFRVGFGRFLKELQAPEDERGRHGQAFWLMQDLVDILRRWAGTVPDEHVHIITIPSGGPGDLLWRRFAGLVGVDHEQITPPEVEANTSLGAVETALLRSLNRRVKDDLEWADYERVVKHDLVPQVLGGRPEPRRIALSGADLEWAVGRAGEMLAEIGGRSYDVIGGLDEVTPAPARPAGQDVRHPDDVTTEELLEAALDATRGLVLKAAERERQVEDLRRRTHEAEHEAERARQEAAAAHEAMRVAYERPVLRHLAHRIGQRKPVVMRLMETAVRVRRRLGRGVRR